MWRCHNAWRLLLFLTHSKPHLREPTADLLLKNIQCITELLSGYARLETAAEKRQLRQSFSGRHYLVLADGFYEWKTLTTYASNPTTS